MHYRGSNHQQWTCHCQSDLLGIGDCVGNKGLSVQSISASHLWVGCPDWLKSKPTTRGTGQGIYPGISSLCTATPKQNVTCRIRGNECRCAAFLGIGSQLCTPFMQSHPSVNISVGIRSLPCGMMSIRARIVLVSVMFSWLSQRTTTQELLRVCLFLICRRTYCLQPTCALTWAET